MKKIILLFLVFFIINSVFSQKGFYFNYARCEITGVFNGELIKRESKNVRAGLDDFSQDFLAVVNFDDFRVKNKVTGEDLDFNQQLMKIKGQIPLDDMRSNTKQMQNYKMELEIIFPNQTINTLFNMEVQYFANGEGFRVVRMRAEIEVPEENERLKGFEKTLFIDLTYHIYKLKSY